MRLNWTCFGIANLTLWISAAPAAAQSSFQWRGPLTSGQTIEVRGINGDIRASGSSSAEVEVTATRSARRSNPDEVRIEVVPHGGGVTICAIYPSRPGDEPNRCEPGGRGRSNNRDNDTSVHFEVRVPNGVNFLGRTVNGEVAGMSLRGDAEAYTVNGSIRLTTAGRALATTVNGSVDVTMGRTDWPGAATFTTVNGGITLTLPTAFAAQLRAEMLHGTLSSDFPVSITSAEGTSRLRGTIGSGGRELNLSTVNGSIRLLKGPS